MGMVSRIVENKPYEFVSIEHLGIVHDDIEDRASEEATKWNTAHENYTFHEKDGTTELLIDMDVIEEYVEMFSKMWPDALRRLKEITEQPK